MNAVETFIKGLNKLTQETGVVISGTYDPAVLYSLETGLNLYNYCGYHKMLGEYVYDEPWKEREEG